MLIRESQLWPCVWQQGTLLSAFSTGARAPQGQGCVFFLFPITCVSHYSVGAY